jgi:hypothetical protein
MHVKADKHILLPVRLSLFKSVTCISNCSNQLPASQTVQISHVHLKLFKSVTCIANCSNQSIANVQNLVRLNFLAYFINFSFYEHDLNTHACVCMFVYVRMYVCTYVCMYVCMCMYICIMYLSMCVYVCMCVCTLKRT